MEKKDYSDTAATAAALLLKPQRVRGEAVPDVKINNYLYDTAAAAALLPTPKIKGPPAAAPPATAPPATAPPKMDASALAAALLLNPQRDVEKKKAEREERLQKGQEAAAEEAERKKEQDGREARENARAKLTSITSGEEKGAARQLEEERKAREARRHKGAEAARLQKEKEEAEAAAEAARLQKEKGEAEAAAEAARLQKEKEEAEAAAEAARLQKEKEESPVDHMSTDGAEKWLTKLLTGPAGDEAGGLMEEKKAFQNKVKELEFLAKNDTEYDSLAKKFMELVDESITLKGQEGKITIANAWNYIIKKKKDKTTRYKFTVIRWIVSEVLKEIIKKMVPKSTDTQDNIYDWKENKYKLNCSSSLPDPHPCEGTKKWSHKWNPWQAEQLAGKWGVLLPERDNPKKDPMDEFIRLIRIFDHYINKRKNENSEKNSEKMNEDIETLNKKLNKKLRK